jgi:putative tryptophan/tyrosine transport system substrate-binding protein
MGRIRRRQLLIIAGVLLAAPLATLAQQARPIRRIGFLASSSAERAKSRLASFRQALRELGYVEGQDVVVDQRYASGRSEDLPKLAVELVRLKVDVLVTEGTPAARAAKTATSTIPVIMGSAGNPVGAGLVASLARPGANVTGLSNSSSDLVLKRLELLKTVVPSTSHIAVLLNPANPTNPLELKQLQSIAPSLGVTLSSYDVRGVDDIERAYEAMRAQPRGAVLLAGDGIFGFHRERIVALAASNRLATLYPARHFVDSGGLMSYATNFDDLFRRAASYVDKVLKGAKPADLPIEQPTRFELVINLKTAKALGITVPQSVLVRADELLE